jgi:dTDP-4-dehydrorhamnose reductase
MSNLVLGYGQLGKEIVKQTNWDYISREKNGFDFRDTAEYAGLMINYDTIINCIANTKTYSANKNSMMEVNFTAVYRLANLCMYTNKKLVHISTDYIYADSFPNATEEDVPLHARNWYTYSKLLADGYIQSICDDYLLIRTSFKPYPFPYEQAITTQVGNFDYTDIIAKLIIKLINKDAKGVFNVGTEEKSMYDLAKRTRPDVAPTNRILDPTMPTDITMNITKMKEFLKLKKMQL